MLFVHISLGLASLGSCVHPCLICIHVMGRDIYIWCTGPSMAAVYIRMDTCFNKAPSRHSICFILNGRIYNTFSGDMYMGLTSSWHEIAVYHFHPVQAMHRCFISSYRGTHCLCSVPLKQEQHL
jgi:hypothetical protein